MAPLSDRGVTIWVMTFKRTMAAVLNWNTPRLSQL